MPANDGCTCVSEFTQKMRLEFGEQAWVDHVMLILQGGRTHRNGRFTVTIYKNGHPDQSSRQQFSAAYCPICGTKYPKAMLAATDAEPAAIEAGLSCQPGSN